MAAEREPYNPFYILLLVCSLGFVMTALAVAVVPVLEDKAREVGSPPPQSDFRASVRSEGWLWLLYQGGAVTLLAGLSMLLDRLRRLKIERTAPTIPPAAEPPPATPPGSMSASETKH